MRNNSRWTKSDIERACQLFDDTNPKDSVQDFWVALSKRYPERSTASLRAKLESLGMFGKSHGQMCDCGNSRVVLGRRKCERCLGDALSIDTLKEGRIHKLYEELGGMAAAARVFETTPQRLTLFRRNQKLPAILMYKMLDAAMLQNPSKWRERDARELLGVPVEG
tara:strand:- start:769 stop:1266 length:498 start_codon:yes stop_codon:yes gene_type:complete